ncbi:MAG: DUF2065 domain-containing protein [Candidatus Diapherotrites archaeon]|nr:DUF2065 domain-containing protein [Candidatus Diapherotrites archaeon]
MDNFVVLIGAIAFLRGLQYVISPQYIRMTIEKWQKMDNTTYRLFGAFAIAVGAFIVYLGVA